MITNQKATPADNARLLHEETQAENDQLPSNRDISTHGLFAPPSLAGCRRQRRLPPRHRKELPVLRRLCTSVDGALLDWCFRPEPLLYQHPRPGSPGLSCHCLRNGLHVLRGRSLHTTFAGDLFRPELQFHHLILQPYILLPVMANNLVAPVAGQPLFRAVASSTRPLYQLLRCVNFTKQIHVLVTEEGIRFSADLTRVMQGTASLDKKLFTTYSLNIPQSDDDWQPELPSFQIQLPALLETLQIFGAVDSATRTQKAEQDPYRSNLRNYRPEAFSNQTLGIGGTCCLQLEEEGGPLSIIIEESGVKTVANLSTYVPEIPEDIPFNRDELAYKIIMQSRYLLDALAELSPNGPKRLTITTSKNQPYLTLAGTGDLGSSVVDFAKGRELLETFAVQERWAQTYKFDLIKSSTEAMRIASKISLRGDRQGVLSLQFMVEVEGGGVSFLDFRFVPFISHEDGEDDSGDEQDD